MAEWSSTCSKSWSMAQSYTVSGPHGRKHDSKFRVLGVKGSKFDMAKTKKERGGKSEVEFEKGKKKGKS